MEVGGVRGEVSEDHEWSEGGGGIRVRLKGGMVGYHW